MLSPVVFSFSPARAIFCTAVADCFACVSSLCKSCSVSMISLCSASYCCCEISPLARAVFACSAAVFKVSSFVFVLLTACARSLCFCERSSVLPGSNFNSFSTSFNCDCVFLISELTPLKPSVILWYHHRFQR